MFESDSGAGGKKKVFDLVRGVCWARRQGQKKSSKVLVMGSGESQRDSLAAALVRAELDVVKVVP